MATKPWPPSDRELKTLNAPSIGQLEDWFADGVAEATDGCRVEPDGTCPHGKPSWLIELGYC